MTATRTQVKLGKAVGDKVKFTEKGMIEVGYVVYMDKVEHLVAVGESYGSGIVQGLEQIVDNLFLRWLPAVW